MCVISFYRPGVKPNEECLKNGARSNDDGHGYAVIVGDSIHVGKSMDSEAAIAAFLKVREAHPESYALFHSRITTDGVTDVDNCHPFMIGGDSRTVLAHNGILPDEARPAKGDNRSDTRILAEDLIPQRKFGHLSQRRARRRLRNWLLKDRYPNKVVILTTDPAYGQRGYIINQDLGEWSNGVWWSNSSYKGWSRYSYSGYSYGGGGWSYGRAAKKYYSFDQAAKDTDRWDNLLAEGTISHRDWLEGVTEVYSHAGTWIESTMYLGPPWQLLFARSADSLTTNVLGSPADANSSGTGWPESANKYADCLLCNASATVNVHVGYCTACNKCADCEQSSVNCHCYIPHTSRRWADVVADDDGDSGAAAARDDAIRDMTAELSTDG